MAGALIEIEVKEEKFREAVGRALSLLTDLTPVMELVGAALVFSVQRNFEAEGRPPPWVPLSGGIFLSFKRRLLLMKSAQGR